MFIATLLLAGGMASCSNDDVPSPDVPVEPTDEGYMGVKNPRQTAAGTKDNEVTWSCIEFGAYPANEVVSGQFDAVDGYAVREGDVIRDAALYEKLVKATWTDDETMLDGRRYRRLNGAGAVTATTDREQHYRWADTEAWHYFEYAPMKTSELLAYASHHEGGWQSLPEQDREISAIQDVANYGFVGEMNPDDSTYLASKYFPAFIQSYEHTQVLNYDQYLYAGTSADDVARMDSAFVAKDLAITHHDRPSLFMDMAMTRRHVEIPAPVDDGSIHLQEVQVMGTNLEQFYRVFGKGEYNPQEVVEKAWAHDVNLKGPISSLINWKKIHNYKRAKKLIKQYGADDAEREALMKAWEQTQKK